MREIDSMSTKDVMTLCSTSLVSIITEPFTPERKDCNRASGFSPGTGLYTVPIMLLLLLLLLLLLNLEPKYQTKVLKMNSFRRQGNLYKTLLRSGYV